MTEKDFVFAWLLATRAGWNVGTFVDAERHISEAQNIYKLIQQECNDEADSRTTD